MVTAHTNEETRQFQRILSHRISFQFVMGGFNQLISGIIIYFLGSIAQITRFDLFILFSLKNMIFWRTLAYIFLVLGVLSLVLSVFFWRVYNHPTLVKVGAVGAGLQIPFVFFGPFIGILLWQNIKLLAKIDSIDFSVQSQPENTVTQEMAHEVGLLLVGVGIYRLGLLILCYLFTIALSLLEVSIGYPTFSMETIYVARKVLLGFAIFTGLQMGYGLAFARYWNKPITKYWGYFFSVLQLFLFPVGIIAGISLLKSFRTLYPQNNT
ncbi:MAG: hypothetical protein ACTSWW_11495 [Promethearchaeota archaeon]